MLRQWGWIWLIRSISRRVHDLESVSHAELDAVGSRCGVFSGEMGIGDGRCTLRPAPIPRTIGPLGRAGYAVVAERTMD